MVALPHGVRPIYGGQAEVAGEVQGEGVEYMMVSEEHFGGPKIHALVCVVPNIPVARLVEHFRFDRFSLPDNFPHRELDQGRYNSRSAPRDTPV